ncbi:protein YIPF1-like isoform X2 [Mercenaria mercenaria]|uniref:protein YIPF1-like isoform X2 n=1 Tax=Mercenaria mercenaria TaxID=6596 RepID=UPI00234E7908|nr:protein YIPF1-like isoform X2 [Mercenaria mercenaria]
MSGKDGLEFHDSGGDDVLFDQGAGHTHTFTNFPASAVDDDEESGDKSQLLKDDGGKRAPSFWTFEYYQQFFDVETHQVLHRVAGSMMPLPKRNYLQLNIRPNPDLYGPFWICTTLVFTTAIAGNLANYLSSAGKDYHWRYDFHKVTFAATAIFSYWWLIPAMMYAFLWWRKSQAGFTFLEILCVYGYSLAIYIPISILWVVNIAWFKWVLVIVGAVLSGGVLVITFWPAVKDETKNVAAIFLGLIFLFHLGLAAGFVLYFFHVPPPVAAVTTPTTAHPTQHPQALKENLQAGAPGINSPKTSASRLNNMETSASKLDSLKTGADDANKLKSVNKNPAPPIQGNPAQPSQGNDSKIPGNASGVGGGTVGQGNVIAPQQNSNIVNEDKVRTKLDTGNVRTNLKTGNEKTNLGERKIRSKLGRTLLKERQMA